MADLEISFAGGNRKRLKDMGDGTYAEVVAIGANDGDPIQLTGDVVLDTFGALDDSKETDPDAASATMPSLLRGLLFEILKIANASATSSTSDVLRVVVLGANDGSARSLALEEGGNLASIATAIGSASDSPGDNTVIGQLKQIAANTSS